MKKLLTASLLTTALCGAVSADTIWTEDFSSYVDVGITGLGNTNGYPEAVTKWSIDVSNCTLSDEYDYFMAVDTSGGRMEAVDIDGEAVWTSELIDISSYSDVSLSVDTSETGSSTSASKYVRLFYKLNGEAEIAFSVNPTNTGNWGEATATQSGLFGSTIQIVARVNNPNSGDKSIFDNVIVSGTLGTPANVSPVLDTIGDQAVILSNELSFAVSATDINGDDIVLSASNLPPNAVFNTITNAAAVTNTFTWTEAAPTGTYSVTFYADDGTTNVSETIQIIVSEPSVLMITEIADPDMTGGQYYRFVEIYNAGNDTIDLAAENWTLSRQNSGSTWYDIALTGTVAAAETYVVAYNTTNCEAAYGVTPDQADTDIAGNGDDAYFLYSGGDHSSGTLVDIYGEIDTDGTGTAWDYEDSRAARNATASAPSPVWIASQWDIISGATTNDMNPGVAYGQPPVLDPIGNQSVLEEQPLTFDVTASDPVDGDTITLTATNLPSGAVFTNGTFTWNSASPAGEYDVTFTATDKDGSDSEIITITVIEKPLLMLSEIADPAGTGGGNYRFVELYNAGSNTIDLAASNWYLSRQDNGNSNYWYDVALTGSIGPTGTYVVAYSATNFLAAYGFEPNQEDANVVDGNGRDIYALYYGGDHSSGLLIDIYGEINTDGAGTAWDYEDDRAERNNPILEPNPVWTASEWTITVNAYTNEFTPGIHGPTPEFSPVPEDQLVLLGEDLSLIVTAVNTVRTDTITLSATNLPSGAVFPTMIGTNTVSSTLNWTNPPAGTYSVTFAADGDVDTIYTTIEILVVDLDADTDGDGVSNGDELIAGTDIYSAYSYFHVSDTEIDTNGYYTLSWYAYSGRRYTVLWTPSLLEEFQPQVTLDAPTNSWTDINHTTATNGFYKLEVEEIP